MKAKQEGECDWIKEWMGTTRIAIIVIVITIIKLKS